MYRALRVAHLLTYYRQCQEEALRHGEMQESFIRGNHYKEQYVGKKISRCLVCYHFLIHSPEAHQTVL